MKIQITWVPASSIWVNESSLINNISRDSRLQTCPRAELRRLSEVKPWSWCYLTSVAQDWDLELDRYLGEVGNSMCTVCALGMYKPVSGDTTCQSCLANADRPAESISFEACLCNAGFSGSDWNGGSSNLNKKGLSHGVMVTVTLVSIFAILALFCGVPRYSDMCNICKAVSAAIQQGEDIAGAEAASSRRQHCPWRLKGEKHTDLEGVCWCWHDADGPETRHANADVSRAT